MALLSVPKPSTRCSAPPDCRSCNIHRCTRFLHPQWRLSPYQNISLPESHCLWPSSHWRHSALHLQPKPLHWMRKRLHWRQISLHSAQMRSHWRQIPLHSAQMRSHWQPPGLSALSSVQDTALQSPSALSSSDRPTRPSVRSTPAPHAHIALPVRLSQFAVY